MRLRLSVFAAAFVITVCVGVLAGCDGRGGVGKYDHTVGTCSARDGLYKIQVKVWRAVGVPDAGGKSILIRACAEANR